MGLVVIGLILIGVSVALARFHSETGEHINLKPWAWLVRIAAVIFICAGVLAATVVFVRAGYRGVLLQFGAVKGTLSEGIHLIAPYVNSVEMMESEHKKKRPRQAPLPRTCRL